MSRTDTITNTDDTIDIRDVIARVEELREQRTDRFVAGYNMPGYMPDSEPAEFDNPDDARTYIADEIRSAADALEEEDEQSRATALRADADTLEASTEDEFGAILDGYSYWITRDGTMGLDDDETAELASLESLLDECKGYGGDEQWEGDWYPGTLIRDDYFQTYAQELADDLGSVPSDAAWPLTCIDWEQAARELRMDYTGVEFGDVTYWTR